MRIFCVYIALFLLVTWTGCADYGTQNGDGGTVEDASPADGGGDGGTVEDANEDANADDGQAWDAGGDSGGDLGADQAGDYGGDQGGDEIKPACPRFISALAECPYQLVREIRPDACPQAHCMNEPCERDQDCPLADASENGDKCVLGNCVYCWKDTDCQDGFACRGGRCVDLEANPCGNNPTCQAPRCSMVSISERPCPVCVCDSIFQIPCEDDFDCQVISSHPYRHCVYGRCAECKDDSECSYGDCMLPGLCYDMRPHPEVLYGAWLIGWYGGLDHFSYFRFEPDGTFRRGTYEVSGAWSDDIPALPCWPNEPWPMPLVGSWEPEVTNSGFLVVRVSLNVSCDDAAGWSTRYSIGLSEDGMSASFLNTDGDDSYEGFRVPMESCSPDFSICDEPTYP